jgi:hypothetical protein
MDDKDLIRVDLLKFRRKAYLAYPVGSPERKNFLKTILQNELQLTTKEMPHELINLVMEGDSVIFKNAMKQFAIWGWFAFISVVAFFGLHHVLHSFSFFFLGVGAACLSMGINYLYGYWLYCKSVKVVKQYSDDMKQYIAKISNDIKRLDGPR